MIKVLIIEDEILARLGLHQLVDWTAMGFELLEDAKTGSEALEKIITMKPQIILLDLNIPEIDGIQIQKYISENNLRCYTIVVSCNDTFDNVKDVMRFGAYDFLHKLNLTPDTLTSVLNRCKYKLEESVQHNDIISPVVFRFSNYEALFTSKNSSSVFVTNYESIACLLPKWGGIQFYEEVDLCMTYLNQQKIEYFLIAKGDKVLYLLLQKQQSPAFFDRLLDVMTSVWHTTLHMSVHNVPIHSLETLHNALAIVDCVYVYAYYDLDKRIFHVQEKQHFLTTNMPEFQEDILSLKLALTQFSHTAIRNTIQVVFRRLRTQDMLAENVLKRMFMDLLGQFSTTALHLKGSIEDVFINGENYHYQSIMKLTSLDLTEKMFLDFIDAFLDVFYIRFKSEGSDILNKAFAYIEQNISQPIHLVSVAQTIGISESYLSSFFKREMGETFVTYVTKVKMDKAKALLQQRIHAYQVSEALGFENYSYFSKVFKRIVGITPDAYHKKFLQN